MELKDKRAAFKGFFLSNEAGKELLADFKALKTRKLDNAMKDNSLDYLSQAKGVDEAIELIENVIKTEVLPE